MVTPASSEGPPLPDSSIAIATADAALGAQLESICSTSGYRVSVFDSMSGLARAAESRRIDAALIDTLLLDAPGLGHLVALVRPEDAPTILLVSSPDARRDAYDLLRYGARDVLHRPPHPVEVRLRVRQAIESRAISVHLATLEEEIKERSRRSFNERTLVNRSPAMRELTETLQRVAAMRTTVFVHGESGVGKELVARALHFGSPRRDASFIVINCAALPPHLIESELFGHERGAFTGAVSRRSGKFELAHRGTLFLDEVAETDLATQAKLLRVLEDQEFMRVGGSKSVRVDVRLVAATNADIERLVRDGRFREDLYYRLKVVTLRVPPLRERRDDLPELVETFLDEICRRNQLRRRRVTAAAFAAIARYPWPGNARELMNTLEAVVVSTPSETVDVENLPAAVQSMTVAPTFGPTELAGRTLKDIESEAIRLTLAASGGSRTHAARALGIGVRTLRRKIRALGLDQSMPARPGRPSGATGTPGDEKGPRRETEQSNTS